MRIRLFTHSLTSDWNHGNAHFLRGIAAELVSRGHDVLACEPRNGWSIRHLRAQEGPDAVARFARIFPHLNVETYEPADVEVDRLLDGADLVLVHEWTPSDVLAAVAAHRMRAGRYVLLFHDTHHRTVSEAHTVHAAALEAFDGVLAFGASLAEHYRTLGWGRRVWIWHEAADTRVFYPRDRCHNDGDLVWIGNWGDDERAAELDEFLIVPAATLALRARVHGVRYPAAAVQRLERGGLEYAGWVPNDRVPDIFARFRVTVHVPRRFYVEQLPGIPTIRPFEAMACGIPLVSALWRDTEALFRADDFVSVRRSAEMTAALRMLLHEPAAADAFAARGLETIRARHTCAHRVDELLQIVTDTAGTPLPATVAQPVTGGPR